MRTDPGSGKLMVRMLVAIYDPIIGTTPVRAKFGWRDPNALLSRHSSNVLDATNGQIWLWNAKTIVINECPTSELGHKYDALEYERVVKGSGKAYSDMVDYGVVWDRIGARQMLDSDRIDEVAIFGGPFFGFYESVMNGVGAYFCNGPVAAPITTRRFITMGYSYERGEAEMMENLMHRAENILAKKFNSAKYLMWFYTTENFSRKPPEPQNEFEQFILSRGTAHRVPGSPADRAYYWNEDPLHHHIKWMQEMPKNWIEIIFRLF